MKSKANFEPSTLAELKPGQCAQVSEIKSPEHMRRRLMDIGLICNTNIECVGKSPCNDPHAYLIRGAVIALRNEDCRNIIIENIRSV